MTTPQNMPLFGAEDLHDIERVNKEIDRNSRAGRSGQPARPLFEDQDQADGDGWSISYGGTRIGTARQRATT